MTAQFDSGFWQCYVSATTYHGRLYLRDTLESEPVYLSVLYPPSHATIKVANDVRSSEDEIVLMFTSGHHDLFQWSGGWCGGQESGC